MSKFFKHLLKSDFITLVAIFHIPYSAFFDVKDCDDNRQAFFLKDELESAFAEEIILVECPLIKLVPIRISPDLKVGREINNVFYETLREPLASDTEQKF